MATPALPEGSSGPQSISSQTTAPSVVKHGRFSSVLKGALAKLAAKAKALGLDGISLSILLPTQIVGLKALVDPTNPANAKKIDKDQPPILMIHGFLGRSNHWIYHRHSLAEKGLKNLFTVDLGSPHHSVEHYANVVHKRVLEMQELTGRKEIILVAHSMGGLVADAYKKLYAKEDGVRILDTITIGTPLEGTKVAYLAALFSKAARQMLPSSTFSKSREMNASRTFTTKEGTRVHEQISIDKTGIKTILRDEVDKDRTIRQIRRTENPKTKRAHIETKTLTIGKPVPKEPVITEEDLEPESSRTMHIGSEHDTIVPYKSSISRKTDEREGTEDTDSIKAGHGGHGWQLFSKEVHAVLHLRIQETIQKFKKESVSNTSPTVDLSP